MLDLSSPCIKVCRLRNGVCIGCFRTQDEIREWLATTNDQKNKILENCKMRKEQLEVVQVKKVRPDAYIPTRESEFAAGADLYAVEATEIPPGKRAIIPTGIAVAFSNDVYLRIAPRSGLAWKNGVDVLAGVVDSDYRGELKVILVNHSDENFTVSPGDRIAQMILEKVKVSVFEEVRSLSDTGRGSEGFGSTGV